MNASICEHCDLMIVEQRGVWVHNHTFEQRCWAPNARPNGYYWEAD